MIVHIMDQPQLKPGDGPIGLILAPTRELSQQVSTYMPHKFESEFLNKGAPRIDFIRFFFNRYLLFDRFLSRPRFAFKLNYVCVQ